MNGFYWLASYPKSGNTWLRLFLESMAEGGTMPDINKLRIVDVHAASRTNFDRILDIESEELTDDEITCARPRQYEIEAQEATAPLLRKVHDAWVQTPACEALFPPDLTLGVIYIVRDPRDVAVSLAHHLNRSTDHAIEQMSKTGTRMQNSQRRTSLQLPERLLSWSQHVESWLDAPVNRLLIRYEDMLSKPATSFGEISSFLKLNAMPHDIEAAVDAVRFDRLRAAEKENGFVEAPFGTKHFFRRGTAGGWQDSLTLAQISRIETDHGSMMKTLGYL